MGFPPKSFPLTRLNDDVVALGRVLAEVELSRRLADVTLARDNADFDSGVRRVTGHNILVCLVPEIHLHMNVCLGFQNTAHSRDLPNLDPRDDGVQRAVATSATTSSLGRARGVCRKMWVETPSTFMKSQTICPRHHGEYAKLGWLVVMFAVASRLV